MGVDVSREGKSHHFGGIITVWENSLSVYAPPNATTASRGSVLLTFSL